MIRDQGRSIPLAPGLRLILPILVAGVVGVTSAVPASAAPAPARPLATAPARTIDNCPRVPGRLWCLSAHVSARAPDRSGAVTSAAGFTAYGPADLASAYRIPASGSTATVAVVDAYDAPTVESDLAHYRSHYGLPACTTATGCFRKVNQNGTATPPPREPTSAGNPSGWAGETTLDVQMVSAVCPSCHILLIESKDDDRSGAANMETAVNRATTMGARHVSMSWGGTERSTQLSRDQTYLHVPGVTYVAAAGDSDYGTAWPAVSPAVVAVGGTTLRRSTRARGWSESVWGYSDGTGTGSGCSRYEPKPSWQASIPSSLCNHRAMNDVSVVADPNYGVAVYQDGNWYQYGGTSAGSPIITAMYAMVGGATSASPASYPYGHRGSFNDITANTNGGCGTALCAAGTGWDGPTGLGTPIGLSGFLAPGATAQTVSVQNPGTRTTYAGDPAAITLRARASGPGPLTFSASGLPPGTSMRTDGRIVGTPISARSVVVTVRVTAATGGSAVTRFRWNVVHHRILTSQKLRITGKLHRGRLLTARFGTFRKDSSTGAAIHPTFHRQWYVGSKAINGAIHKKLRLRPAYRHHRIAVRISASKTYYVKFAASVKRRGKVG